jgi:hypothetical protein
MQEKEQYLSEREELEAEERKAALAAQELNPAEDEEEGKKGPPEIIISLPVAIEKPEDLVSVLFEHQKWLDSVIDPRKKIAGGRANLKGANLSGFDLSGVNLSGATMVDVNLTGANLTGANLVATDFTGANLQGAKLFKAKLKRAILTNADLREADMTDTDLSKAITHGTIY